MCTAVYASIIKNTGLAGNHLQKKNLNEYNINISKDWIIAINVVTGEHLTSCSK